MKSFRPKEISWLSFNERVLQEASKLHVPLIERFRFLGIYSNNLDEFFRVRVATLKRLSELGERFDDILGDDPKVIQQQVNEIVLNQRKMYEEIQDQLVHELSGYDIHFLDDTQVSGNHLDFIIQYFYSKVRPKLMPIMIDQVTKFPELDDDAIYLAIILGRNDKERKRYALIKVPTDELPRFLILPRKGNKKYMIFLEDVIRLGLDDLFHVQKYNYTEAYTIKVTRDAELDIDDDLGESYVKKITRGLKRREEGDPVRLVYDVRIPEFFLDHLKKRMGLREGDAMIPGGRYHNLKDFIKIPNLGPEKLVYSPLNTIMHPAFLRNESIFDKIRKRDIMLHFPYHSFDHFIDLLREASIDPKVKGIKITLYRLAKHSSVVSALLSALKNGKLVTVVIELTARFSEQSNIVYSQMLKEEGARVIYGVTGLKVHAKLCQISRREKGLDVNYTIIGTGNFNEETATVFSDILLFTRNPEIGTEVEQMFSFFRKNYRVGDYHLLVPSPFRLRRKFNSWIYREIENAKLGKQAYIHLKLNNLVDREVIDLLLMAARNGVEVKLNVRGMYSLITPDDTDHQLEAIALIDRYLEHTRLFFFCNGGDEQVFFSSADLMARNLDRRVEITCPVLEPALKKELRDFFNLQWKDNTQVRILDKNLENRHRPIYKPRIQSQMEFHRYLSERSGAELVK